MGLFTGDLSSGRDCTTPVKWQHSSIPSGTNECLRAKLIYFGRTGDYDDFTRLKVALCGSVSLPSMIALHVVVMVSASSKLMVKACMWDSVVGSIPHVESKSNLIDLESDAARVMAGRLP